MYAVGDSVRGDDCGVIEPVNGGIVANAKEDIRIGALVSGDPIVKVAFQFTTKLPVRYEIQIKYEIIAVGGQVSMGDDCIKLPYFRAGFF